MVENKIKQAYAELLEEINSLCERAQFAIQREKETLVKKIVLLTVLFLISASVLAVSVWQLCLHGLRSSASGALLFATVLLSIITVLFATIMISDIRQSRSRLKTIMSRFNLKKEELEEGYKKTIKNL